MSKGKNGFVGVYLVLVLLVAAADVAAQEETTGEVQSTASGTAAPTSASAGPATASSVLGVAMTIGRGLTPVLAEPRRGAPVVARLVGTQLIRALATEPGLYRPASRRWVLVDLAGARTTGPEDTHASLPGTGEGSASAFPPRTYRYGWVALERLGSGEPPRTEALLNGSRPGTSPGSVSSTGVLLHHPPERGEQPRQMFYLDIRSGSELPLGLRYFESRIIAILQESKVLVMSMGTGPGNPQPIDLINLSDGTALYSGYTWSLHDAIREDRYIRVIPGKTLRDAPGYLEDPHPTVLEDEPYLFGPEQLEEYRDLWETAQDKWYESIRIIPQVWLDTHTGEMSTVEFTISRYVEQ